MAEDGLKRILEPSRSIVFFGGAGVSTESGIPDFRSETGLYRSQTGKSYRPEQMLSYSFFTDHTRDFYEFYKSKMIYRSVQPNKAHRILAEWEKQGRLQAVVTQNIDGLHQAAGSQNVQELHGSVHRNYCMDCGKKVDLDYVMSSPDLIPYCQDCHGIIRPDVVLYEEGLDMTVVRKAAAYIAKADVLIVGGTSLVVYPAAGLVDYYRGDKLVLINKQPTPYDRYANLVIHDSIGKVLGDISL